MLHVNFGITRTYYEQYDCDVSNINNAFSEAQLEYGKSHPDGPALKNMDLADEDWEILCDECGAAIEFNRMAVHENRIVCPQCKTELTAYSKPSTLSEQHVPRATNLLLDYLHTYNIQRMFDKRDAMKETKAAINATVASLVAFGISCTVFWNANTDTYVGADIDGVSYTF